MTPVVALTIAGSDPSGGAGIHADLRTFAAHRVHGTAVVAALTAQNTCGVQGLQVVPSTFVAAQIRSVTDDLDVRAAKTGMLGSARNIEAVAYEARTGRLPNLVVDPVLVSSTGAHLFDDDATSAFLLELFPHASVVTPNRLEAGVLCNREVKTLADMKSAAQELSTRCPAAVVVKGGDAVDEGDDAVDIVVIDGTIHELRAPLVQTDNDHGTGCSFAAATAAQLALGFGVLDALTGAKRFVHTALVGAASWRIGSGRGPIDHFGWGLEEHVNN